MRALTAAPRQWIAAFGEIANFSGRVVSGVLGGRVLRFFAETLRQAGILILGSALVIWGLAFILGLQWWGWSERRSSGARIHELP